MHYIIISHPLSAPR